MKTTTILHAWDQAAQLAELHPDNRHEMQRATRIWHGLVRRIEAGDKAREALKLANNAFKAGSPINAEFIIWEYFSEPQP